MRFAVIMIVLALSLMRICARGNVSAVFSLLRILFRVLQFRVLQFRVLQFRVLQFRVLLFRVLQFKCYLLTCVKIKSKRSITVMTIKNTRTNKN